LETRTLKRLNEGYVKVQFDRLTLKESAYVAAMAEHGQGPHVASATMDQKRFNVGDRAGRNLSVKG
jgi:hypothetical protein